MIGGFTFRQAVWLFPPAFILHVVEEWPQFTRWAQTHASGQFTRRDYNAIHVAGIFASVLGATLVWLFPNPAVVLLFFTFLFAPSVFFQRSVSRGRIPAHANLLSGRRHRNTDLLASIHPADRARVCRTSAHPVRPGRIAISGGLIPYLGSRPQRIQGVVIPE